MPLNLFLLEPAMKSMLILWYIYTLTFGGDYVITSK